MSWDRFFFYLHRVNALLFLAVLLFIGTVAVAERLRFGATDEYPSNPSDFGVNADGNRLRSGESVKTPNGDVAFYFERAEDDPFERRKYAGLSLVHPGSGKAIALAPGPEERLVRFEFLFDEALEERPVVGYVAMVSDDARFEDGRADIVIGALPGMTKTVVAQDILLMDMPTVRSDGSLGLVLWTADDQAELVGFRLDDGTVTERAKIELPALKSQRISIGKGGDTQIRNLRNDPTAPPPVARYR